MYQEGVTAPPIPTAPQAPPAVELPPVTAIAITPAGGAGRGFLTRGNVVLLALYVGGFGGLWLFGRQAGGPNKTLADQKSMHAKVESALNLLEAAPAGTSASNAKAIVSEFYMAAKQRQLDAELLTKNPFIFEAVHVEAKPVEPEKPKVEAVPDDNEKYAMAAVKGLRLQSVLMGKQTMAVISNNMLTEGQKIGPWLVSRIDARQVELTWKDKTHVLKMP